jgi:hypothetical protein
MEIKESNKSMIYTITTFGSPEPNAIQRTVGYFTTLEEAQEAVLVDGAHLHEALYDYALIESIVPGIYPHSEDVNWFKWNKETRGWSMIPGAPDGMEIFCNFSIG